MRRLLIALSTVVLTVTVAFAVDQSALAVETVASGAVVVRAGQIPQGEPLSWALVGCDSITSRRSEPVSPAIAEGPGTPPAGTRSVGLRTQNRGNAAGLLASVQSVRGLQRFSTAVYAAAGTVGVSYIGYRSPDQAGTSLMWLGRAAITVPAGGWTRVDTGSLVYDWSVVSAPGGTVRTASVSVGGAAAQIASTGDGAGFAVLAFGCDGTAFDLDAAVIGTGSGTRSYDFEGEATVTGISASSQSVAEGDRVTFTATLQALNGSPVPGGIVVLERLVNGAFMPVAVLSASSGSASVGITVTASGTYRFRAPERSVASGSASGTLDVVVRAATTTPTPTPTPTASATPSSTPSTEPEPPSPSGTPSSTPDPTASSSPTATATTPSSTPSSETTAPAATAPAATEPPASSEPPAAEPPAEETTTEPPAA